MPYILAAFFGSTVIPLLIAGWLWKRFHFDVRMVVYLFTLVPYAGALAFVLAIFRTFGFGIFLFAAVGYFYSVLFLGAGWTVVIGVVGWLLAVRIQARARFNAVARFAIGAWLGLLVGAIVLASWWIYLTMFLRDHGDVTIMNFAVAGGFAGAVGGIVVVAFTPANVQVESSPRLASQIAG